MSNFPEGANPYPAGTPGPPTAGPGVPNQPAAEIQTGPPQGFPSGQPTSQFPNVANQTSGPGHESAHQHHPSRRSITVKSALKTTEFWVLVVLSLALLLAAAVTDQGDDGQGFGAQDAWRFITILGAAYMLSRGLTKFGGREEHDGVTRGTRS